MLKKNKIALVVSSLIILLPMIAGLILWNRLPDTIATHFGADGQANGWSSKAFTVFCLPAFLLAVHWLCVGATAADPKRRSISDKLFRLILWIIPLVSLFVGCSVYSIALGYDLNVDMAMMFLIGILFIIIGNYLPKCRQNYTMGIKLPWTLASEDNWNRTHRMAGKLWIAGGVVIIAAGLFRLHWLMLAAFIVLAVVPMAYSYLLFTKRI